MFDDLGNGQATNFLLAIGIVAAGLLALFVVFWLIRKRSNSTFIRGGKNRQPRLAVLDAAAVDTRRRLVLIRRDSVEHLILIGGPTDIVIESGITRSDSVSISANEEISDDTKLPALEDASGRNAEAPAPARLQSSQKSLSASPETQTEAPVASTISKTPDSAAEHPVSAAKPASGSLTGVGATATATATKAETDNALDVLDAARNRVLSGSSEQVQTAKPTITTAVNRPAAKIDSSKPVFIADAYFENDVPVSAPQATKPAAPSAPVSSPLAPPRQVPVQPASTRQQPGLTDFEAILEAELAEDFELDNKSGIDETPGGDDIDESGDLSRVTPDKATDTTTPPKPDYSRSDTLEDEMDKLLGDLSRRK